MCGLSLTTVCVGFLQQVLNHSASKCISILSTYINTILNGWLDVYYVVLKGLHMKFQLFSILRFCSEKNGHLGCLSAIQLAKGPTGAYTVCKPFPLTSRTLNTSGIAPIQQCDL